MLTVTKVRERTLFALQVPKYTYTVQQYPN